MPKKKKNKREEFCGNPRLHGWSLPWCKVSVKSKPSKDEEASLEFCLELLHTIVGESARLREVFDATTEPSDLDESGRLRADAEITVYTYAASFAMSRLETSINMIEAVVKTQAYELIPRIAEYYNWIVDTSNKIVETEELNEAFELPAFGEGDPR